MLKKIISPPIIVKSLKKVQTTKLLVMSVVHIIFVLENRQKVCTPWAPSQKKQKTVASKLASVFVWVSASILVPLGSFWEDLGVT